MQWLLAIPVLPYFFLLLKIFNHLRNIKPYHPGSSSGVSTSVIIACRNEAGNIGNLLSDLSQQDYNKDLFEVIVIDDNSDDNTFEAASGFRGIKNLRVFKNKGSGKKRAVTTGVNAASGELIMTTDADCRMGQRWISTINSFFFLHKPDMIICPVKLECRPGFAGRFQELEFLSLQGVTAGTAEGRLHTMCNGANMAFARHVFIKHSENLHYEIASGDDVFFLHSLKKEKGSKIMWIESPDSMVTASSSDTLFSFLKQRKRWISKGSAYEDGFTILLAIVTFVTILLQFALLVSCILLPRLIPLFLSVFVLKSIPDFLILYNTTRRYNKKGLMKWFLPSQVIYPFYVIAAVLFPVKNGKRESR